MLEIYRMDRCFLWDQVVIIRRWLSTSSFMPWAFITCSLDRTETTMWRSGWIRSLKVIIWQLHIYITLHIPALNVVDCAFTKKKKKKTFSFLGLEHNFNKYDDSFVTDLNTAYDYESVMHYRPFAFNKDPSIPTITTNIPEFQFIIGQYLDFSEMDIVRLNRMYNCCKWPYFYMQFWTDSQNVQVI